MTGIHLAAIVAALLAAAVYGSFLAKGSSRSQRVYFAVLLLLQLPMSAAVYYGIRVPLQTWLPTLGEPSLTLAASLLAAPVLEEPAKLWPLLLPFVFRRLDRANSLRTALALGLGFGLGEIAFLADILARQPGTGALPWTAFGPFIAERVMVCLWHVAFTALTVFTAARRPAVIPVALLGSMGLHFVGNFPIHLMATNAFGLGAPAWTVLLFGWTVLYTAAMGLLMLLLARKAGRVAALERRTCRRCSAEYPPPLTAANFGAWRYERCPACGKWQWA